MTMHWLSPLLQPKSIAIVGASEREGSIGAITQKQLFDRDFKGKLYPVNPRYPSVLGVRSYDSLENLPEVPDLVLFAISGKALESSFDTAIALGVGGIAMYASNHIEEDEVTSLPERLRQKASAAGIPVLGGNSMGFYNYDDNVFLSFDHPPQDRTGGGIGLIAHSGSAMTYLANNDSRFKFNYVIPTGQETNGSVGDYVDFLLDQASTRVVAIFLEAIRDIDAFTASLAKAQQKNIPVVILKLGRTEKSAAMAISHSGALAGNHDAFLALCKRHSAIVVNDIDELITTAYLFSFEFKIAGKQIASILDSGGLREMLVDLASDYGVELVSLSEQTKNQIQNELDVGLKADNPLDAMGALNKSVFDIYFNCAKALVSEPDASLLTFEFEFRDGFSHYPEMFDVVKRVHAESDKPVIVFNSSQFSETSKTASELTEHGIPVIQGIPLALRSIKHLLDFHNKTSFVDAESNLQGQSTGIRKVFAEHTSTANNQTLSEFESLKLLRALDLPGMECEVCECEDELLKAINHFAFPVVLKTAEANIHHKSDLNGVRLGIKDIDALINEYRDLNEKIGPRVLLAQQSERGVEISLGMKLDPQYGAMIVLSVGGTLIEILHQSTTRLAPVSSNEAEEMIEELIVGKLLRGVRGNPPCDKSALVDLIARFSQFVYATEGKIAEIDMNPVIVNEEGCTIVDALIARNPEI
ncbi:MAG: acetate--CoA ligase family protein [Pseudomonadota bacterium]